MHTEPIDIFRLPIPDWGLECPKCRCALVGLPAHRCPECGLTLDMQEIVKPWTRLRPPRYDGSERPLPDFRLDCPACGNSLAGASGDHCAACSAEFELDRAVPDKKWIPINGETARPLTLPHLQAIFLSEQLPHVPVDQRTMHEHVLGTATIGSDLLIPREFWFEARWMIATAIHELHAVRAAPPADWKCARCDEEVPANFDVCWNCSTTRGATP